MGKTTHGMHKSPEYHAWEHMHHRCANSNNPQFKDYGGRGISVCESWRAFENFYADMGPRPDGMTLERRDNDGNYTPMNCCWATRLEQAHNRRGNKLVTYRNETLPVAAWAQRFGLRRGCMLARLKSGWTMDEIASTPASKANSVRRKR